MWHYEVHRNKRTVTFLVTDQPRQPFLSFSEVTESRFLSAVVWEIELIVLVFYFYTPCFNEDLGSVLGMKGVFCFTKQLVSSCVIVFKFYLESVNAIQQFKDEDIKGKVITYYRPMWPRGWVDV